MKYDYYIKNPLLGKRDFIPYHYQKLLLERFEDYDNVSVLAHRQSGKSLIGYVYALEQAKKGVPVLFLTPNKSMGSDVAKTIIPKSKYIRHIPDNSIDFINGSSVVISTPNIVYNMENPYEYLKQFRLIIMDEVAYFSDSILSGITGFIDLIDDPPRIITLTSANKHKGYAYNNIYNVDSIYFKKVYIRPFITNTFNIDRKNKLIKMLGDDVYKREYELKWK